MAVPKRITNGEVREPEAVLRLDHRGWYVRVSVSTYTDGTLTDHWSEEGPPKSTMKLAARAAEVRISGDPMREIPRFDLPRDSEYLRESLRRIVDRLA